MTLYEFNSLDTKQEKLAAVIDNGKLVGDRDNGSVKVLLYQIGSFYVELMTDESLQDYLDFRSFSSVEPLKPYLEKVDISKLIE